MTRKPQGVPKQRGRAPEQYILLSAQYFIPPFPSWRACTGILTVRMGEVGLAIEEEFAE